MEGNLHPTGLAIGEDNLSFPLLDRLKKFPAHFFRDGKVFLFHSIRACQAAARFGEFQDFDSRDEGKKIHRRETDPQGPKMAGSMVIKGFVHFQEFPVQLALIVQMPKELKDVGNMCSYLRRAREIQDLLIFLDQGHAAARGRENDFHIFFDTIL
jgi:hypothetical protein